jgi:hypothetical protein
VRVTRPLASLAAGAATLSVLLSGCGVAGTDWHPGVAAQVGDEQISVSHVNEVVTQYCNAVKDQLTNPGDAIPLRYLREGVTGELVLVAAARQLGKEYGVDAGDQYTRQVAQLEQAVSQLPQETQDAVIEIESAETYVNDILQGVGEAVTDGPTPASDKAIATGRKELVKWIADNDVEIAPQFGVEIVNGEPKRVDTDLSVAAGGRAQQAVAPSPAATYVGSLPSVHRCG